MIRIIYDGQELDINPKQDFFLSFTGANLTSLGARSDAYSNTFELPTTSKNRLALGLIESTEGSTKAAFISKPCQIYDDNTLLLNGIARVPDTDTNIIRLEIAGAIGGLIALAGDKSIREYTFANNAGGVDNYYTHYNYAEIDLNINDREGFYIRYALFNNGSLYSPSTKSGLYRNTPLTGIVPNFYFQPWFSVLGVFNKAFASYGYELFADGLPDEAKTAVIGGLAPHGSQAFINSGTAVWNTADQTFTAVPFPGNTYTIQANALVEGATTYGGWNVSTNEFTAPTGFKAGWYKVSYRIFKQDVGGDYAGTISIKYNGYTWNSTNAFITNDGDKIIERSVTIYLDDFTTPTISFEVNVYSIDGATLKFAGLGNDAYYLKFEPVDRLPVGGLITARCLPDVSLLDLLKDYANRYGLFIKIDDFGKTVTFAAFDNLNQTPTIDWTEKVGSNNNAASVGQYRSLFTYGTLAKQNWFRNAGDLGPAYIPTNVYGAQLTQDSYTSKADIGIDFGYAIVAQMSVYELVTVKDGVDVFAWSPTAVYTDQQYVWFNSMLFKNTGVSTAGDDPRDHMTLINIDDLFNFKDAILIGNITKANDWQFSVAYNNVAGDTFALPNGGDNAQVQFALQYWNHLLNTYQSAILRILYEPRMDKMLLRLNTFDVNNIDFSKPVSINGINYYVNLIDQYDPVHQGLVICELVQIPPR
jgi:hypothetical protein